MENSEVLQLKPLNIHQIYNKLFLKGILTLILSFIGFISFLSYFLDMKWILNWESLLKDFPFLAGIKTYLEIMLLIGSVGLLIICLYGLFQGLISTYLGITRNSNTFLSKFLHWQEYFYAFNSDGIRIHNLFNPLDFEIMIWKQVDEIQFKKHEYKNKSRRPSRTLIFLLKDIDIGIPQLSAIINDIGVLNFEINLNNFLKKGELKGVIMKIQNLSNKRVNKV